MSLNRGPTVFRSRDWLSANQGAVFPDSVGTYDLPVSEPPKQCSEDKGAGGTARHRTHCVPHFIVFLSVLCVLGIRHCDSIWVLESWG